MNYECLVFGITCIARLTDFGHIGDTRISMFVGTAQACS